MTAAHPPFNIVVLAGDGIGPEVMDACLRVLATLVTRTEGLSLEFVHCEAGAGCYQRIGEALPDSTLQAARKADAILLAAMGLPTVRYPNGTEIAPQLDLRERLQLYAGVRPIRALPGVPPVLADERARGIDLVLIRESTEGLFAARGRTTIVDGVARDTMLISRATSERLFEFAFTLARQRKQAGSAGRVTCVDKANVLGSLAYFRSIFLEVAGRFPDIGADCAYVDAVGLNLVRQPWIYDVLVTENMFGDILSDVGAALIGGMGFAPSADIGHEHAVFQPCHGSAPDIAGSGIANPAAMLLSAAMMLRWLGESRESAAACAAAAALERAVLAALADGSARTRDIGGEVSTDAAAGAVAARLGG